MHPAYKTQSKTGPMNQGCCCEKAGEELTVKCGGGDGEGSAVT